MSLNISKLIPHTDQTSQQKFRREGGGAEPSNVLVLKNTFTGELTIPVISATSERTFSALRRLKNYLRSTVKHDRLNNCLLMHCHKSITDILDTVKIGCANEQCEEPILEYLSRGKSVAKLKMRSPPPLPHRFKMLCLLGKFTLNHMEFCARNKLLDVV